jgi:hypothetical protein
MRHGSRIRGILGVRDRHERLNESREERLALAHWCSEPCGDPVLEAIGVDKAKNIPPKIRDQVLKWRIFTL